MAENTSSLKKILLRMSAVAAFLGGIVAFLANSTSFLQNCNIKIPTLPVSKVMPKTIPIFRKEQSDSFRILILPFVPTNCQEVKTDFENTIKSRLNDVNTKDSLNIDVQCFPVPLLNA